MNAWWTRYLPGIMREQLGGRPQLQITIGNAGWLLFDRILRMVIGVTIGAWVARYLGPAQFGELAYVISFIAFFQVVSRLEAEGFIVRDIAQERGDASVVLGTTLWLRLLSGLFSWVVAVFGIFMLHPDDGQLILLTAIVGATLVFQAADTVDLWFQSQNQNRRTVIAKLVSYLFSNGVKVVLLCIKAPLVAFAGVICLEGVALALSLVVAYRRFPAGNRWSATSAQAKALLGQCWPFIASGLMITTYLRIDQIMIKEMLGEHELGIYAAALPISQVWAVIPSTLLTTLWPYVSRKKMQGEQSYQDVMVKIFRLFALVALVGSALTAWSSPWLIGLLYGPQYQAAARILSIHVFVNLFVFQNLAQNLWVINNNVQRVVLPSTLLAAIISIMANFLLINRYGIIGAAFSIVLTEAVSAALPCLLQRELLTLYKRAIFFTKT
ncbi:MAG TPA: flippase [Geobacteraceae bacterium]|nr:flippase [Geobacteraceae bacterium]